MKHLKKDELEPIPPLQPGRSYRPEDIRRWGVARFLNEVAPKEPVPMPDFQFTDEENRLMDELLKEEQELKARGIRL